MSKQHKKGMELQVNLLITIIIAVAVFVLALAFGYRTMSASDEMVKETSDTSTEMLKSQLISEGARVIIPFQSVEATPGKAVSIDIGILNIFSTDSRFGIQIIHTGPVYIPPNTDTEPVSLDPRQYLQYSADPSSNKFDFDIVSGATSVTRLPIRIPVDSKPGTYLITVRTCYCSGSTCPKENKCSYDDWREYSKPTIVRINVVRK